MKIQLKIEKSKLPEDQTKWEAFASEKINKHFNKSDQDEIVMKKSKENEKEVIFTN